MNFRESLSRFKMLSELYANDSPRAVLLPEYPSSNSKETNFQNSTRYVIHDPFPPPRRSLMKVLGPHHLMCCWGDRLPVTSEIQPPQPLIDHWQRVFGEASGLNWQAWNSQTESSPGVAEYITLYPHESISPAQQVIDPDVLHELHSKEVIQKIDCDQAAVLSEIEPPCVVKLSHGYAGLGNFLVHNEDDITSVEEAIAKSWPNARLIINELIANIAGDFGVQFYLGRDGGVTCLGLTEQKFDQAGKWIGGHFVLSQQTEVYDRLLPTINAAASYLHEQGYFGVVGVDILVDQSGNSFLVDVNPRLTGITPFLIASRLFLEYGFEYGIYQASFTFAGSSQQLFQLAESLTDVRVLVLAVLDEPDDQTICHLSISGRNINDCRNAFDKFR